MIVRLDRTSTGPDGTFGTLTGLDFDFYTVEKRWVDVDGNGHGDPQVSCISPAPGQTASYQCVWQESPKYGWSYEVTGVPGRSRILIHAANHEHQLLGCIALGKSRGVLNGKAAVMQSRDAIKEFHAAMRGEPFTLEIRWANA